MATQQKASKPNYQVTLQRRAKELVEALESKPDNAYQLVLTTLKDTALESWKNGIEAGQRKAQRSKAPSSKTA